MNLDIQRVGILGAGQMGAGIAQTAAQSGFHVYLADQSQEFAEKGKQKISSQLKKLIEKGKIITDFRKNRGGWRNSIIFKM